MVDVIVCNGEGKSEMEESKDAVEEVKNVEIALEVVEDVQISVTATSTQGRVKEKDEPGSGGFGKRFNTVMMEQIVEEKAKEANNPGNTVDGPNDSEGADASGYRKDYNEGQDIQITEQVVEEKTDEATTPDIAIEEPKTSEEDEDSESADTLDEEEDNYQVFTYENDEAVAEVRLTDIEIDELVSEFLEVESRAAEAQEALEKESLAQVESDVRAELAESFQADELERAVASEMETFVEQWASLLDDLEAQSALLLEQLDGAGIELPSLYKWIESQTPSGCSTEAWKKRAHWVGSEVTGEFDQSVKDAECHLQSCRPVRRRHGRLLEEGASGFLGRKLSMRENEGNKPENAEKDWSLFNSVIQSDSFPVNTAFGSEHWAAVYLASTPQQAAKLGLNLPGVDEVEEIDEVDCSLDDPFYATAIANEKEIDLSEEQRKNFRKIREEDDAKITRKLQHHLKQKRQKNRSHQVQQQSSVKDTEEGTLLSENSNEPICGKLDLFEGALAGKDNCSAMGIANEALKEHPVAGGCKRPLEHDDNTENKKCRTVVIDIDDEVEAAESKSCTSSLAEEKSKVAAFRKKETVEIIDLHKFPSPIPKALNEEYCTFKCTACLEPLRVSEVLRHPLLDVTVCRDCKLMVEEKLQAKEAVASDDYCRWCGKHENLIACLSCKILLCAACISRNLGEECLMKAKAGWKCCCCLPDLLSELVSECKKALEDVQDSSSGSDLELSGSELDIPISNRKRRKKRIRRILDDAELGEETKQKIAIEQARQEHLKSMQKQSASKSWNRSTTYANGTLIDVASGDEKEGYIINVAREEDEVPVRLPPSLSNMLKPHQVAGIRFMWENIVQSVKKVKSGDKGLGCILAHTMGLGKTFQVIAFLYAAMRCVDLGLKAALIVTPVNVLHNWRREFLKWKPVELKPLRVLMLEDVSRDKRPNLIAKWRVKGGVLLIGYASFRNLSLGRHVKDRNIANEICEALQYGPDILICDEAHMIKNTRADTTLALKQVKTQRRIALTGSPLQNNLMEYYCMVDFVREGFLGSSHEFRNRFQNPIENGQHANSTSSDVKIMNQRSHILYEQLKGFVQRMDMNVVKKDLPPKTVFVITVKLSPLQRMLYKKFLDVHGFTNRISCEKTMRRRCFFAGYQALAQIWNHPGLLQMAKELKDNSRREDSLESFLMDDGSSDDNLENLDSTNGEKQRSSNVLASKRGDDIFNNEETNWWEDLLSEKIYKEVDYSGKMVLLLDILSMSSDVGDKALVFSQSLATLDLIELLLSKLPQKGREGKYWKQEKDWYRLDGSTEASERQRIVEKFNDPSNTRVKCTLISTRAGSLGINLYGANRVVIVDGSWNPTYDLQAIYRAWRYGQSKPVYAYRLMAHGTMEEKIYKRQVTKEGLAARVVDRQQIHRTMSKEEMLHLFEFGYDENPDTSEQNQKTTSTQGKVGEEGVSQRDRVLASSYSCASDDIMDSILNRHYPRWIANYHEHETLLQENEAERLSKEEQDMAWQSYQRSLEWEVVHSISFNDNMPSERSFGNVVNYGKEAIISQQTRGKFQRHSTFPENNSQQTRENSRNRPTQQKKCSNLSHLLTLRSKGTKPGSSTVCSECSQEISWETLNRDGKFR